MPCVYLPGPAPAVTVANRNDVSPVFSMSPNCSHRVRSSGPVSIQQCGGGVLLFLLSTSQLM